jgi:hypothetical protein
MSPALHYKFNLNPLEDALAVAEKINPKLYHADYIGSGTFIISKPKRKKTKARQQRLKSPGRGMRK